MDRQHVPEDAPRDAQLMATLLASMDVEHWEPRVVNQMLDWMARYSSEVLKDSKDFAAHAGRDSITVADVQLAIDHRLDAKSGLPSRTQALQMARQKNSKPLRTYIGEEPVRGSVLLPPFDQSLMRTNYQMRTAGSAPASQPLQPPQPPEFGSPADFHRMQTQPGKF